MFVMLFVDMYEEGRFVGILCETVEQCEDMAVVIDNSNYCEDYEEHGIVLPHELARYADLNVDMTINAIENI